MHLPHKKQHAQKPQRIGIFAGTFNPVHSGHVAFALQALNQANLDMVYIMPERRPRHKTNVEHYGHRVAMVRRALQPHPKLQALETDDISFTVARTLPRLRLQFPGAELVLLMGSDVAKHVCSWAGADVLLAETELVVGLRNDETVAQVQAALCMNGQRARVAIVRSSLPAVSSRSVRVGLSERRYVHGLLSSVVHYSNRNWLYVSLGQGS